MSFFLLQVIFNKMFTRRLDKSKLSPNSLQPPVTLSFPGVTSPRGPVCSGSMPCDWLSRDRTADQVHPHLRSRIFMFLILSSFFSVYTTASPSACCSLNVLFPGSYLCPSLFFLFYLMYWVDIG